MNANSLDQLRNELAFRRELGSTVANVRLDELDALLGVVERFAARDPRVRDECVYCRQYGPHAEDCIHATARRLCGMEDAE